MRDYLALGISLVLAFVVWLAHNLALEYTTLVQRTVVATCEIAGHSNVCAAPSELAASCHINGLDLLMLRMAGRRHPVQLEVAVDDMHHQRGDVYYMTVADLTKYFHNIFSDKSRLEYFATDTVFFTFKSVEYKKVPVTATVNLTYKPQYMAVGGLKVTPDSVLIYGDKEVIGGVHAVTTDLIRHHDLDAVIYGKADIKPMNGIRMSASKVDYSIDVDRYVQREVQVPVRAVGVPHGINMKVFPSVTTMRYRMRFPADVSLTRAYVAVDYADFQNSISGKCVGKVMGLPADVLSYELSPEVFECLLEADN